MGGLTKPSQPEPRSQAYVGLRENTCFFVKMPLFTWLET